MKNSGTYLKPRFRYMTIGIGLITHKTVILAADSRTEDDESSIKRFDLSKIESVECGKLKCGIVRSGMTSLSGRAVELVRSHINDSNPTRMTDLLEIVRSSVMQVRRDFISANPSLNYADPTGRFSLIIASHDGEIAGLHVAKSHTASLDREPTRAYIGSGKTLADYILSGLPIEEMDPIHVGYAALYAAEIAQLKDSQCEGPISVYCLDRDGLTQMNQQGVNIVAANCRSFERERRDNHIQALVEFLNAQKKV